MTAREYLQHCQQAKLRAARDFDALASVENWEAERAAAYALARQCQHMRAAGYSQTDIDSALYPAPRPNPFMASW